jgi:hypothetical protein
MYSQRSVELALPTVETLLGREPVFHSIEACDEAVAHFADKKRRHENSVGVGVPLLYSEEEIQWIKNERALCKIDYLYFATRYAKILDADEKEIHYAPNIAQRIVNQARAEQEDLGWAIMQVWLKGRQCGITTDSQVVIGHRTLFFDNVIALTGSSDKERSYRMVSKYKRLYASLPEWMVPAITVDRAGTRIEFGALNSSLIIQHGSQKYDIGRGDTPSAVHLSELATYTNAADLIDAGLVPAVHESARKIIILESTGEGPYGWLYDTWNHCKKFYWLGQAKFRPGFLPWFVASDFYPTHTWLKRSLRLNSEVDTKNLIEEAREKLADWHPEGVTVAHAENARKFVRANELLRRYFPENWVMPKEQLWFWQVTRDEYRNKKILARFQREFAASDIESFCASGESVFDVETISDYTQSCEEPKGVFGFRGPVGLIPPRLQADEHDRDKNKPILDVGPYQMVPLRWEGWATSNWGAKLLVFRWPEQGEEYGFGVDTGDGIGQDRSVIEGLCKGTLTHSDQQVCEFASDYINANDLAPILHCIGMFYQNGSNRQPKIAIETGLNGEVTQLELRKLGWGNFHQWIRYDRKKISNKDASRIGFVTNRWSRPMLMDYLIKALRDGELEINSPEFVREMSALHRDEGVQAARAEQGQHDDRFIALGIIYLSLHILEFTGKVASTSYLRQKRAEGGPVMYRETMAGDEEQTLFVPKNQVLIPGTPKLGEFFSPPLWHPGQYADQGEVEL